MEKHAYMIMAHHRPDLLQLLINALDDKRNDIIVHIDKKSKMMPEDFHAAHGHLIFTERMCVNWGGYSQVQCEYLLMKKAVELGHHIYYHFLTGSNFPLWPQDYIYNFFQRQQGRQFIGFDHGADFSLRVKYYIPFSEHGKLTGISGKAIQAVRAVSKALQDIFYMDRRKNTTLEIQKGCAYFSITEELVKEIISRESEMEKLLQHTLCCDEIFVQTIAINSPFKADIYDTKNEYNGCLREFAWPSNIGTLRPGWNFTLADLSYLLNSKRLFAMKFESPDGKELIAQICKHRGIL